MTIHSYRRVLKVRRHIHVIPWSPGKALVLPYPVPLMGLMYFAALEATFFVISRLPVAGSVADLPFKFWWVLPFVLTYLLIVNEPAFDGRMPHVWLRAWITYWWRPKRTRAGVPVVADGGQAGRVRWFVDEHAWDLHRARIVGPARVRFRVPVRLVLRPVVDPLKIRESYNDARPDVDGKPLEREVTTRLEVKP